MKKNTTKADTIEALKQLQESFYKDLEFGTGGMVEVPQGLEDYSSQFKGKGIKQVNLPSRPFLFNSAFEEVTAMRERVLKATKE